MPGQTIDISPVLRGRGDRGPTYYAGDEQKAEIAAASKGGPALSGTASVTHS